MENVSRHSLTRLPIYQWCECIHICYLMEIIILRIEMLQTHGVEKVSRVVRHCNTEVGVK